MVRKCGRCKIEKSLDDFNKHPKRGWQAYCRECNKLRSQLYYANNIKKHRAEVKKRKKANIVANRERLCKYLIDHPCVDCGENDIVILTFDHIKDEKDQEICKLLAANCSWKRIMSEIEKCEVRCANCHTRRTAKVVNNYKIQFLQERGV